MAIQRTIKIITKQDILKNEPKVENFPTRKWSIEVVLLGKNGEELPAKIFDKVTYKLHPTFVNPTRHIKEPPFKIEEKGWGEFDLTIVLVFAEKAGEEVILHDLNFKNNRYEVLHTINIPNKPGLLKILQDVDPNFNPNSNDDAAVPASAGTKRKADVLTSGQSSNLNAKIKKKSKGFEKNSINLEKLTENLQKLSEEDLLVVVEMVTDNKTNDMYVKNDVEEGEFHMDLYTLPDSLLKSLWEFVKNK